MKKNDFENRLQNDLFPQMPASFEHKLTETMENEGVRIQKRPTSKGLLAGALGVVAAAACLVMVLVSVLGGGKSKQNAAASGDASATQQTVQPTPEQTTLWNWDTKVIPLSSGFEFENQEKYEALYTGILRFLMIRGETEPDELWLCAIKPRRVGEIAVDGYLVLAQHSFDQHEGPELYCVQENGDVLWATEGSALGPNRTVNPQEDEETYAHFIYGAEPMIAEPGVPHVKRGAVVGKEKGTDIEFSMAASITEVQNRLSAAGTAYPGAAREFFMVTVPASSWNNVMQAHTLRFETEEGNVDVNMETDLPLVATIQAPGPVADLSYWSPEMQEDESGLAPVEPTILDLTDDHYGAEAVQTYADAILLALRVMDLGTPRELWICGVAYDLENEDGTPPDYVYILAEYAFDGGPFPELFYFNHGAIEWMTLGAETYDVNVVHHNGNTLAFAVSPAYDGEPLAMNEASLNVKNAAIYPIRAQLPLTQILDRVPAGSNRFAAREYFLWLGDGEELEVKALNVTASKDGRSRSFTLDTVNVLEPQHVPAMAVEIGGSVYTSTVTHLYQSLNADGVVAEGTPIQETLEGATFETVQIDQSALDTVSWQVITSSDKVSVHGVDIYSATYEKLYNNAEISAINGLDPGTYYLCFRTIIQTGYSTSLDGYTYNTVYFIYKATIQRPSSAAALSPVLVKEKLGVPDAYQFSTTEADGRLKIIVDAQVRVPDVERLPMVQVRKSRFSQERINQVAQILFAVDPMYDYDQDGEPLFDGQLRPFQDVYGVHPEVLHLDIRNKPASEWEQSENRKQMIAWASVTEEELRAGDGEHISFTTWPDREEASERYDETVPVDLNAPAFQAAKAHTDAFFQTLGLGDAYCFAYGSQVRDGSGYHLYYTASIQGVEAYVSKNDRSDGEEGHTILWGQESILFVANEDGIQSLSWMHPVEMLETASEAPTLLPFSDIQARFETEVRNKYAILLNRYAWSKGIMEVSVDDIRLCLMRLPIQDGNELESTMIPVWAFYGHNQVERTDGTIRYDLQTSLGNDAPIDSISILVLNAMDGSIITLW